MRRALRAGEFDGRDRGCYLPRDVFFGRLGFAGAFLTVWASDFGRFLPATSDSFPIAVLQAHPTGLPRPFAAGPLPHGQSLRRSRPRRLAEIVGGACVDRAVGRCRAGWALGPILGLAALANIASGACRRTTSLRRLHSCSPHSASSPHAGPSGGGARRSRARFTAGARRPHFSAWTTATRAGTGRGGSRPKLRVERAGFRRCRV
jgi:hypothetical protein